MAHTPVDGLFPITEGSTKDSNVCKGGVAGLAFLLTSSVSNTRHHLLFSRGIIVEMTVLDLISATGLPGNCFVFRSNLDGTPMVFTGSKENTASEMINYMRMQSNDPKLDFLESKRVLPRDSGTVWFMNE